MPVQLAGHWLLYVITVCLQSVWTVTENLFMHSLKESLSVTAMSHEMKSAKPTWSTFFAVYKRTCSRQNVTSIFAAAVYAAFNYVICVFVGSNSRVQLTSRCILFSLAVNKTSQGETLYKTEPWCQNKISSICTERSSHWHTRCQHFLIFSVNAINPRW